MITLEEITTIPRSEFNVLFDASLPAIESGTLPWGGFPQSPGSVDEKRDSLYRRMTELLSLPNTRGVLWRKSGLPIEMAIGAFQTQDKYITWIIALIGPDETGSRSWLYDVNYLLETKKWFIDNLDVEGYIIHGVHGSSIETYHSSRKPSNNLYEVSVIKTEDDDRVPGLKFTSVKFRYL